MRGVPNTNPMMSKKRTEKFFGRKANPDADLSAKDFLKKKIKFEKDNDKIFHTSAKTGDAGSGIRDNALVPDPSVGRRMIQKKKDTEFISKADKKLKGFKFGAGVGP